MERVSSRHRESNDGDKSIARLSRPSLIWKGPDNVAWYGKVYKEEAVSLSTVFLEGLHFAYAGIYSLRLN